jgi:Ku protein
MRPRTAAWSILDDSDFADLPSKTSKEIGVEKFVPADQIDPMWLDKSYYLEPDKAAAKPYVLLRDALESEKRMAIVTVSIRTRMTMAVLRVRDGVIVMQTMIWPDEIRKPDFTSSTRSSRNQGNSTWRSCSSTNSPGTSNPTSTRTTTPSPSRPW